MIIKNTIWWPGFGADFDTVQSAKFQDARRSWLFLLKLQFLLHLYKINHWHSRAAVKNPKRNPLGLHICCQNHIKCSPAAGQYNLSRWLHKWLLGTLQDELDKGYFWQSRKWATIVTFYPGALVQHTFLKIDIRSCSDPALAHGHQRLRKLNDQ